MWVFVDTRRSTEPRVFQVFGTGHEINAPSGALGETLGYLATVQDGPYVWHVLEHFAGE